MRSFILVPVLLAGLAAVSGAAPHSHRRKSLGFGPILPHAVFKSSAGGVPTPFVGPLSGSADPFDVARTFVEGLLGDQLSPDSTFFFRDDSYTDKNTGVTHVYIRQLVNGIAVADGNINVNVLGGRVISYGNSFYTGPPPAIFLSPGDELPHTHTQFCNDLEGYLELHSQLLRPELQDEQVVLSHTASPSVTLQPLEDIHASNCLFVDLPYFMENRGSHETPDSRHALLNFMVAATPNSEVAEDILARYDEHLAAMTSEFETGILGNYPVTVEKVRNVPDTVNPVRVQMAYVQVPHGDRTELTLVWKFEVEMQDNWYEAYVAVASPQRIVSVVDWASDSPIPSEPPTPATYNVFGWGINDPTEGNRSINKENFDSLASPVGWHSLPFANDPQFASERRKPVEFYRNTTTTWGNNVFAHENWEGRNNWADNDRPDGGAHKVFDYTYNPQRTNSSDALDEAKKYINATVTQLFYTSNLVHDLFYRYGFDEVSGNFQQYNFGRGGQENDAVITNAQDGSGYNNANFMTPPDGQNGRCRMYLWNTATPYRDGDLEAGIVIHELSHGLSTRLTGGPADSGCLGWGESGGMGEGWGDFLATIIRSNKVYSDYPMGAWAANNKNGIRNYVYSLNSTVNPSTYKILDKPGYWGVHAIGEVWAQILWLVSQRLIEKHGYGDTLFPPAPLSNGTIPTGDFYRPEELDEVTGQIRPLIPKHGNSLIVQLVLNGMKLQACRPSFFNARDAIIQADEVLTGGENFCDLWLGFAERGLGVDAKIEGRTPWGGGVRTNGYAVPLACQYQKESEDWVMV